MLSLISQTAPHFAPILEHMEGAIFSFGVVVGITLKEAIARGAITYKAKAR